MTLSFASRPDCTTGAQAVMDAASTMSLRVALSPGQGHRRICDPDCNDGLVVDQHGHVFGAPLRAARAIEAGTNKRRGVRHRRAHVDRSVAASTCC